MKQTFTKLFAALALLVSLAIPMGVWGQTKATVTDNMTAADLAATGTSYTAFSNVSLTSDAVYAGKSALNNNANIQLRSSGSDCGIVSTVSGGKIKSITINVASGSNTIDVYGKNTAYTGAAQLYNATNQGTKLGSVSSTGTITVSGDYEYVGIRSYNGAVYISSIAFVWETTGSSVTATTVTIDDSGISNTDVYTSTTAGSLSATVKENTNNTIISGAAVTWSSSNTNIATIDNSGAVTLVAAGTTTITASYAGESGIYGSSSATYVLTVTSSEPYVQPTTIEIIPNYEFWGKTGQFSGSTYDELNGSQDNVSLHWTRGNGSTYANLSAMRFYKDNNLTFTAPEGYEIISIALTVSGSYSDLTFSPTGYDNTTTTWTGSSSTVTMSRPSNASSYAQISKFTITLGLPSAAVATTTTINVPQNFNTDIYQGTNAGTLTATVKDNENNTISGATVTWSSSNTGVATIDANGEVTLVAVGTTTITASYAGVEDQYRPSEGSYELTVTDSNAPGTQNNPYTVAQARAAIDAGTGTQGVYATGIVSSIETAWSTQYSNITFNFVDNAGDTDFLQAYRCVSGTGVDASTVAVGDIVVVHGNLTKYGSTYEFGQGCELVSLEHPTTPFVTVTPSTINAPFAGAEGTLALTYENIEDFISFDYYFCDADGEELAEDPDWINAEINENNDTYTLDYIIDANDGEARTAYIKVYTYDDDLEEVYAIVTVNQAHYVVDYAVLPFVWEGGERSAFEALNGTSTHSVGDYAETQGIYRMKLDGTGDYIQVKCDQRPGKVTIGVKMVGGASTSTITIQGSDDGETFTDVEELTISGAQNDELTLETTNTFAINVRYVRMLFTKGSNVGVGPITIALPLTINGYGSDSNPGGYYLIASPSGTINPANVPGMLSDTYDLYYFDQNTDGNGNEWINYKGGSFNLEPGTGYLYAHNSTITLNFTGTPIEDTSYEVTLRRNERARFKGWNLVGNPFTGHAYLADNRDFYTMNADGSAFELVGAEDARHIEAMEGVFVIASSDEEKLNFTTTAPGKKGNRLALNLRQGNNVIDRAFIRFGECRQMPKLQFDRNSTKLYIPMDDEDYAVVRGEEMGEMPVNFKAESNGTYSLNFGMDNVEFAYLHLIDNLTGNDVDLLQTPSYSFEAKTTDYESRFKLVFATGDNSNEDNFAYFSNGSFVINNEGNATLQVIDITGRIVKSESVNGCANVNVNGAAGVYMLRLVNGDNVKVQKVVVK